MNELPIAGKAKGAVLFDVMPCDSTRYPVPFSPTIVIDGCGSGMAKGTRTLSGSDSLSFRNWRDVGQHEFLLWVIQLLFKACVALDA